MPSSRNAPLQSISLGNTFYPYKQRVASASPEDKGRPGTSNSNARRPVYATVNSRPNSSCTNEDIFLTSVVTSPSNKRVKLSSSRASTATHFSKQPQKKFIRTGDGENPDTSEQSLLARPSTADGTGHSHLMIIASSGVRRTNMSFLTTPKRN